MGDNIKSFKKKKELINFIRDKSGYLDIIDEKVFIDDHHARLIAEALIERFPFIINKDKETVIY